MDGVDAGTGSDLPISPYSYLDIAKLYSQVISLAAFHRAVEQYLILLELDFAMALHEHYHRYFQIRHNGSISRQCAKRSALPVSRSFKSSNCV